MLSKFLKDANVKYVAFQFVDLLGKLYTLWVHSSEAIKAVEEGIGISGWPYFTAVEKSDVVIKPDLSSLRMLPWLRAGGGVAAVMCDMYHPDTMKEVEEVPRTILKRSIKVLKEEIGNDVDIYAVPECEFFLISKTDDGKLQFHDDASYFSPPPADKGYEVRSDICNALDQIGIKVVKQHHEAPRGKHELDIEYDEALSIADKIQIVKVVMRKVASDNGLIATFMPKPFDGNYGAGWHTHISLQNGKTRENLFYSSKSEHGLSEMALYFISGILKHAKALVAISNPTINSYKRLVPGSQAPIYVSWARFNRSSLIRVPASSSPAGARIEYRPSDGSCNYYLAFAALIYAGLDGIAKKELPPPPIEENIYGFSKEEIDKHGIGVVPGSLEKALEELKNDETIRKAIEPVFEKYLRVKADEVHEYSYTVHEWERRRYLEELYTLEYGKFK
jgi:glutamine synthetase